MFQVTREIRRLERWKDQHAELVGYVQQVQFQFEEGDEETDEDKPEKTASTSGKPMLDPELERLLADPLRATRKRYLPAGTYTVDVRTAPTTPGSPVSGRRWWRTSPRRTCRRPSSPTSTSRSRP